MSFDLAFAVDEGYLLAQAAYAAMTTPLAQIRPPMGYVWVDRLRADQTRAAPLMAAVPAKPQIPARRMVAESATWGVCAYAPATGVVLLALRGTETIWEWLADFDADVAPFYWDPSAGMVHLGMQLCYAHVRDGAIKVLQGIAGPITAIRLQGHSLGGALAQALAFDLARHAGFAVMPSLMTWEQPRFGTGQFNASLVTAGVLDYTRIVNPFDLVPRVPVPPLFLHGGTEAEIWGCPWKLDPVFEHHLTTVKIGLDTLWRAHLQASASIVIDVPQPEGSSR